MKISSLLLFIAAVSTIDTTDAITRRLGSTHHSLALGGGSSSSLLSVDQDDNFYSLFQQQLSADSTSQRRQYSPATSSSSSSSVSSDKSSTSTSTTLSPIRSKLQFPRGRGIINNNIKNINMTRFSDYLYDENEGTLYSLPSIATFSALLKIRGGGTVCVDNEGDFYYPSTAASATGAAPQQQQQRSHTPWQLITHLIDEQFLLHYQNHRTLFLPKLFWHHHQD